MCEAPFAVVWRTSSVNLRKYGQKLLIRPSDGSMKTLLAKVRAILKANPQTQAGPLIVQLNAVIRGWANYHCHVVSKATFNKMDWHIHWTIRRWARKKHRRKREGWIIQKYFKTVGARNWDVLVQFLTESLAVTLVGMAIGGLLGGGVCTVLAKSTQMPVILCWEPFALGMVFALFVGTIFGVQPARRAARLHPVEALR